MPDEAGFLSRGDRVNAPECALPLAQALPFVLGILNAQTVAKMGSCLVYTIPTPALTLALAGIA